MRHPGRAWSRSRRASGAVALATVTALAVGGCDGDEVPTAVADVEVLGTSSSQPVTATPGLGRRMLIAGLGPVTPGPHLIAFADAPRSAPFARVLVPAGFQGASDGRLVAGSGGHQRSVRFWTVDDAASSAHLWLDPDARGKLWIHSSGDVRLLVQSTYGAAATREEIAQVTSMGAGASLVARR